MLSDESTIDLPPRPAALADRAVAAWREPLVIDTYLPLEPEGYPAYLDRRVYQGSSGAIYPLPFHERIDPVKRPRTWDALHLENDLVRLVVLPELGGRIHIGLDLVTGEDFFYRNNVIKPALVGLAGPWISGGVELNWPQHHRPATFLPTQSAIEEHDDGSVTLWCSDHDPFDRMKGMHGIRLHPGSSVVELVARLFNRSEEVRTFLWWANVAVAVGDDYQSFFPTDVNAVADHAKRATTAFPATDRPYYGVDYRSLVTPEQPEAHHLDRYRNILVPTSYMVLGTSDDFFGGYDHATDAGVLHWADHRVAPGKKQWTWGNHEFGWAWDRNLTDSDGPYVELMAGVFTDNQPDFSFLAPGETKTFSQFWYPIAGTGVIHQATLEAAVHLDVVPHLGSGPGTDDGDGDDDGTGISWAVAVTRAHPEVTITVTGPDAVELAVEQAPGSPGAALRGSVTTAAELAPHEVTITVSAGGTELLTWTPRAPQAAPKPPAPATEPARPHEIASVEELYLTGLHLAQYRHATRSPEPWWDEALRRDPGDSRTLTALAARRLGQGRLADAVALLEQAVARLTRLNPNPRDGEAHYLLGLALTRLGRDSEAYEAFGKALWNGPWLAPSRLASARIQARRGRWSDAVADARDVLAVDANQAQARAVAVIGLRRSGASAAVAEAESLLAEGLRRDPLDVWLRDLAGSDGAGSDGAGFHLADLDAPTLLDLALEYRSVGADDDTARLLTLAAAAVRVPGQVGVAPLALLHLADLHRAAGDLAAAQSVARAASAADRTACLASRPADVDMLARTRAADPNLALAAALHGHWLYSVGREHDAIAAWREAAQLETTDAVVLRNLAVASYNTLGDGERARRYYVAARTLAPGDSRLLYEADQLAARLGDSAAERLAALETESALAGTRDDLVVERADLLVRTGRASQARALLAGREFQPWEGGEGRVLRSWDEAAAQLAITALAAGEGDAALAFVTSALHPPHSLGEGRHLLANTALLHLLLGDALAALGRDGDAGAAWTRAADQRGDFQSMAPTAFSPASVFSLLALRRLGREPEARVMAEQMRSWLGQVEASPAVVDYFATSLPDLLLFAVDADDARDELVALMRAQLREIGEEPGAAVAETAAVDLASNDLTVEFLRSLR